METVQRLRARFPKLQDPPSDDICYATQNRQVAVKAMAPECELVIVVGSRNSSNSVRLVEVALGAGSAASHLVDYADDIDPAWLDGVTTVGVTSGASVPEVLVRGVLERLAEYGYGTVQPVTTANETLVFALPREIRPPRREMSAEFQLAVVVPAVAGGLARPLRSRRGLVVRFVAAVPDLRDRVVARGRAGCSVRPGPTARRGRRGGFVGLRGLTGVEAAGAARRPTSSGLGVAAHFPGRPTSAAPDRAATCRDVVAPARRTRRCGSGRRGRRARSRAGSAASSSGGRGRRVRAAAGRAPVLLGRRGSWPTAPRRASDAYGDGRACRPSRPRRARRSKIDVSLATSADAAPLLAASDPSASVASSPARARATPDRHAEIPADQTDQPALRPR